MPVGAPGWGTASDTLEMAAADFGLAELANAAGDKQGATLFRGTLHASELPPKPGNRREDRLQASA